MEGGGNDWIAEMRKGEEQRQMMRLEHRGTRIGYLIVALSMQRLRLEAEGGVVTELTVKRILNIRIFCVFAALHYVSPADL